MRGHHNGIGRLVPEIDVLSTSWPGLSRPSTAYVVVASKTWMPATSAGMTSRESCVLILLLRVREMAQVRRRLAFSHGHQQAVSAKVIDFLADGDIGVVLGADELAQGWPRVRIAGQIPGNSQW